MESFEAHKYLDPTTFDDQSFLSFSSFADLTHSSLDEYSSFSDLTLGKPQQSLARHPATHSLQAKSYTASQQVDASSSSPPSYTYSDAGSESPSDPFRVVPSSWTPLTPAINDFGIFHSPSSPNATSGPSRLSYPTTTPSHKHVSHRSSSSSDWNSPVTPTLTNKSSIDSLASFAPAPDFFLPPSSSHSAFGWDDQSLGSSSSAPHKIPRSPPSPSPHRIASNPVLAPHRHPRSVKQVTSMPALREEGQTLSETLCQEYDLDGMAASLGFTPMGNYMASPDHSHSLRGQSNMFMSGSPDDGANEMFLNLVADFDGFGTSDPSDPLSSQETSPVGGSVDFQGGTDASAQITPVEPLSATMVQPLDTHVVLEPTFASTLDDLKDWQQDGSFDFSAADFSGLINLDSFVEPEAEGVRPSSVFTNAPAPIDNRPVTAPEPSGSLAVPHMGMMRSVSSDAVLPVKSNHSLPIYTPQGYSYNTPTPDAMYAYPSANPEAWGMTSSRPADLPSPPVMSRRNTSQPLSIHVPAASAYTIPSHGFYATAQQSNPLPPGPGYTSQPPPKFMRGQSVGMKRVGSQPLPGSKAQMGMQVNYYQPSLRMPEHSEEERQRIRSEVQSRKVSMAEASVMQPYVPAPPPPEHMFDPAYASTSYHPLQQQQQQQQMYAQSAPMMSGWESPDLHAQAAGPIQAYPQPHPRPHTVHPSSHSASGPVLTTAPLINVHPPAPGFYPTTSTALPHSRTASAPVHRVHPPPHPGPSTTTTRPIARMPSTPRARATSAATGSTPKQPKPRASPGRKRAVPSGGVDKWDGGSTGMFATTFVNYTPLDGQALLAGVAPSGSQSKRKRERDETGSSLVTPLMTTTTSGDSGSGDESRSKRSKSSAASSPA